MLDEKNLMLALKRHWDYSGKDEDVSHEIYHDDAVLEFPQSGERFEGVETGERFEGVENFREWRRQYPAHLAFHTRRITRRGDLVVVETSSATTAHDGCMP
jgi:ketosteroid isomerase-like protein